MRSEIQRLNAALREKDKTIAELKEIINEQDLADQCAIEQLKSPPWRPMEFDEKKKLIKLVHELGLLPSIRRHPERKVMVRVEWHLLVPHFTDRTSKHIEEAVSRAARRARDSHSLTPC
jgi:hypothetical protein